MSNISKTVTDTTIGSMEVEYETNPGLHDLLPWMTLNCPSSRSSNYTSNISILVTDTIMG